MSRFLFAVLLLDFGTPPASAVAPTNDICQGAEIIPTSAAFPYLTAITDIGEATLDGDPPAPSCAWATISQSIWYRFKPAQTAFYTISSCSEAPTATTVPGTVMAIYPSTSGCAGATNELPATASTIGCDAGACGPAFAQAAITTTLLAGTTYYIVVWQDSMEPITPATCDVQLRITKPSAPSNDSLAGARQILLNLPVTGNTTLASDDYELAADCFPSGHTASSTTGRDVVFAFTAPAAGTYSIKADHYNNGALYDLVLYAVSSLPPGPFPAQVTDCLAAANRSPASAAEEILCLPLDDGQKIYIVVDEDLPSPEGSSFTLEVTRCVPETEPNDNWMSADPLIFGTEGAIRPSNDVDFYGLGSPPAGSRVFAMLDGSAAKTTDFQLRVVSVSSDSTNTLEFDYKNNDDVFGGLASNVAGTPLNGDPAFLRVNHSFAMSDPYRLYAVVQPPLASATPETEPNNAPAQADSAPNNYFYGSLSSAADVDVFAFTVNAVDGVSDVVFLSLDADPLRDNTPINTKLELLDANGNVLVAVDDDAYTSSTSTTTNSMTATAPSSPGEALVYRTRTNGTYYARISLSPVADLHSPGDYLLSISKNGYLGTCGCNTPPELADLGVSSPVYEGEPAALTGSIIDPDFGQAHLLEVDWGDGSANTLTNIPPAETSFSVLHSYPPNPPGNAASFSYSAVIHLTDTPGASASGGLDVVVDNAPPTAPILSLSNSNINEGDSVLLSASFTDASAAEPHHVVVDWGDGSDETAFDLADGVLGFSVDHTYSDDAPSVTPFDLNSITVTIEDPLGGSGSAGIDLQVNNLPPVFGNISITSPVNQGQAAVLAGSFSDPGVQDTFVLTIDWGDGSTLQLTNLPAGATSFGAVHSYGPTTNSNVPVTLVVEDDDSGMGSTNLTVVVSAKPIGAHLQSIMPLPNDHLLIQFQGTPGAAYRIETSSDLRSWTNLVSRTADVNGSFNLDDDTSPMPSPRFYRTVWP